MKKSKRKGINRRKSTSLSLYYSGFKSVCECDPINPSTILPHPRRIAALCWKNFTRIYRNPGLLLFQFLLPAIQVTLFCLAIGRNISGLNVAIVNNDKGESESCIKCTLNPYEYYRTLYISINKNPFSPFADLTILLDNFCSPFDGMNNFGSLFVSKLDHKSLDMVSSYT